MTHKKSSITILTALLFFILTFNINNTNACVDSQTYGLNTDVTTTMPDFPLDPYLKGHLGIINSHFGASYLIIAYRYLQNRPLSNDEQNSMMNYWLWYFLSYYALAPSSLPTFADLVALAHYTLPDIPLSSQQFLAQPPLDKAKLMALAQAPYQDYLNWRQTREEVLGLPISPINIPQQTKPDSVNNLLMNAYYYFHEMASNEDKLNIDQNTQADGFNMLRFATIRLKRLSAEFQQHPDANSKTILKAWIAIQQAIFQHLNDVNYSYDLAKANDTSAITQALALLPASNDNLLNQEKAYFNACAAFYTRDPSRILKSSQQFAALAQDKNYPWPDWMRYLAHRANALAAFRSQGLRLQNTSSSSDDAFVYTNDEKTWLQDALSGMQTLASQAHEPDVKKAAQDYAALIKLRLTPGLLGSLFNETVQHIQLNDMRNYLFWLLINTNAPNNPAIIQQFINDQLQKTAPTPATPNDWLLLWQETADNKVDKQQAFSVAWNLWQATPQQLAWLIVATTALEKASVTQRNTILSTVNTLPAQNSAYFLLRFLALQQDQQLHFWQPNERQHFIDDTLLALTDNDDFRSKIYFLTQHAPFTKNITDLVSHAVFSPSARLQTIYPPRPQQTAYYWVTIYNNLLQQVPLSVLYQISQSSLLPDVYRHSLEAVVWVRAILLGNHRIEQQIANITKHDVPVLQPYIDARAATTNRDEQWTQFAMALLEIPFLSPTIDMSTANTWDGYLPTYRPDSSQPLRKEPINHTDNYLWSAGVLFMQADSTTGYSPNKYITPSTSSSIDQQSLTTINPASFLTDAEKNQFLNEYNVFKNLPNGSEWLAKLVITLAEQHPHDQRYANLLALIIKATRFAAYNPHSGWSKRAFTTLHTLYPDSKAAQTTKYYY